MIFSFIMNYNLLNQNFYIMKLDLNIQTLDNFLENKRWPYLIAGPCSAESEELVVNTAHALAEIGKVSVFRAGIWKPRTRPGSFEGVGEKGLPWLQRVKKETGLRVAVEVANPDHVEACLKAGIDVLWIGARTSVNPFSVQNIADAIKGVDITLMIKNPINPDLQLWMGALERVNKVGVKKMAAIHRGFSSYDESVFRNEPMWKLPIELKRLCPELPIICDPSHITGNKELIPFMAQKALDLDMDGLMIESHIHPQVAKSDAKQQVTPKELADIIRDLVLREPILKDGLKGELEMLRDEIDKIDEDIIQKISARMQIAGRIGEFKRKNEITVLQVNRWEEILNRRIDMGKAMGLSKRFMKEYLQLVHQESIRIQNEIMNKPFK